MTNSGYFACLPLSSYIGCLKMASHTNHNHHDTCAVKRFLFPKSRARFDNFLSWYGLHSATSLFVGSIRPRCVLCLPVRGCCLDDRRWSMLARWSADASMPVFDYNDGFIARSFVSCLREQQSDEDSCQSHCMVAYTTECIAWVACGSTCIQVVAAYRTI